MPVHGWPPLAAAVVTGRARVCTPPPHVRLQLPQAPKVPATQSMGHSCALHVCVSCVVGHATPPLATCVTVLRVRCCEPPPHDSEQGAHEPQSDTAQSMGHVPVPHDCVSDRVGQATPPCWATVATLRERDCVPPPHVFVQVVHGEKLDTTQSTGQSAVPQERSSRNAGQGEP